jgi:acetyl-CoA synthetase
LRREIAAAVATRFGAPYRPKRVLLVSALPKTRNEKIMRRLVRAVLSGTELGDLSSLVNPDAVDELRAVAQAGAPTPP